MKIIKPYTQLMDEIDGEVVLRKIEIAGRKCYKSEDKITYDSAQQFVKMLIERGHEAMVEHFSFSVLFVCDRGVSHELVRHRVASFAQESTRYCNYGKAGDVVFIEPCFWGEDANSYSAWCVACSYAEIIYLQLIGSGRSPQEARSVLPNSLKTEIVVTANLREWRHIFKLRTAKTAHPQMRELMCPLLDQMKLVIPAVFDDITY